MSEFSDMLAEGFAEMTGQAGSTLTFGALSCSVVGGALEMTVALRDTGAWEKATASVDITRTEFDRLRLKDHSVVTFAGKKLKIVLIEPDEVDPVVKIHLGKHH
ncbi:MAG: hypothetical protein V4710_06050 [Verrucomicrobiota bacterium]